MSYALGEVEMELELSVFVAFVVVVNGLLIFAMSRVGRRR